MENINYDNEVKECLEKTNSEPGDKEFEIKRSEDLHRLCNYKEPDKNDYLNFLKEWNKISFLTKIKNRLNRGYFRDFIDNIQLYFNPKTKKIVDALKKEKTILRGRYEIQCILFDYKDLIEEKKHLKGLYDKDENYRYIIVENHITIDPSIISYLKELIEKGDQPWILVSKEWSDIIDNIQLLFENKKPEEKIGFFKGLINWFKKLI